MEPSKYPITKTQWDRLSYAHSPLAEVWQEDPKVWRMSNSVRCLTQVFAFAIDDIGLELLGVGKFIGALVKTVGLSGRAAFTHPGIDPENNNLKLKAWDQAYTARREMVDHLAGLILRPFAFVVDELKLAVGILIPRSAIGKALKSLEEYPERAKEVEGWLKTPYIAIEGQKDDPEDD